MTPDWICLKCGQIMFGRSRIVVGKGEIYYKAVKCTHCGKGREV